MPTRLLSPWDTPGENTGVGCHSLLQGIFPTQRSNPGLLHSVQFSSLTQSCQTLCDPMDCSMPGFPVYHQLLELAQTHVHRVGDVTQTSHPLSSPSPPASVLPSIRVFSSESVLHFRWSKYWSFSFSISPSNKYSGLISFRMNWLDLLQSKGVSRVFSNTTVQKHQFSGTQLSL